MVEISDDILDEVKQRLHILDDEADENLKRMLSASVAKLINTCGDFDIYENEQAKELVFERVRYIYNDVLEHFETNFARAITDLQMHLFLERSDEPDEKTKSDV